MNEWLGVLGLAGIVLALFKINHDKIEKTNKGYHDVDKRLAIIETIFEIKWGKEIVERAKKKNGDKT